MLPRWLAFVLAACAVIVAVSLAVLAFRGQPGRWVIVRDEPNTGLLDTSTGTPCFLSTSTPTCFRGDGTPFAP